MTTGTAEAKRPTGWAWWWQVISGTFHAFFDRDTSPRCAGAAFFGFLSFFPAIATIVLLYGIFADRAVLAGTVEALRFTLPEMALGFVRDQLTALATQPPAALGAGLLVSVPLALWSGSRGVDALLHAMSQVRREPPRRGFIRTVLVAVGATLFGSVFVVIALVTVAGLPALLRFPSGFDVLLLALRWPVLLGVTVLVFGVLYRWGPDRHPRKFRYIWPGAALASVLWILVGTLFSIYVENWGHYEVTFGSVSAAVVLLLWMYNSTQILVLGAAFNAELEKADRGPPKPG